MTSGDLRVSCYAGHRGEETPRRFFLGERAVDVVEVLDRWIAPDHRYFKCKGSDGNVYILRHDAVQECWELTMFLQGSGRDDVPSADADRRSEDRGLSGEDGT